MLLVLAVILMLVVILMAFVMLVMLVLVLVFVVVLLVITMMLMSVLVGYFLIGVDFVLAKSTLLQKENHKKTTKTPKENYFLIKHNCKQAWPPTTQRQE